MLKPHRFRQRITVAVLLSCIWGQGVSFAQSPKPPAKPPASRTAKSPSIRFQPPVPPDPGEPGDRGQGGGRRGPCKPYESLQALVPTAKAEEIPWGLTLNDRPTVWVYAPDGMAAQVQIKFNLSDHQGKSVYKTVFPATATPPGVLQLTLPPGLNLKVGKFYQWSMAVYCDPIEPDAPRILRGRIYKSTPTAQLQRNLRTATTPLQQAIVYADSGIWYDALTTLGMAMDPAKPPNLEVQTAWTELLQQHQFTGQAITSIVPCCTLK
jgi:Domain of Unknown Function (DUF928)